MSGFSGSTGVPTSQMEEAIAQSTASIPIVKHVLVSLNFTAYSAGAYADYEFSGNVYVLSASLVAKRGSYISGFARVSDYFRWTFILNTTGAAANEPVDICYVDA